MWPLGLLGANQLLRNMNPEDRIQYRKQKQKTLLIQNSVKDISNQIIIIVQYPSQLKWDYKCIVGKRQWPALTLLNYMKKYCQGGTGICIPKNKTTININKQIGQLYDLYHDRDDKMLYLMILTPNAMGAYPQQDKQP